jgi:hypothetical protein
VAIHNEILYVSAGYQRNYKDDLFGVAIVASAAESAVSEPDVFRTICPFYGGGSDNSACKGRSIGQSAYDSFLVLSDPWWHLEATQN